MWHISSQFCTNHSLYFISIHWTHLCKKKKYNNNYKNTLNTVLDLSLCEAMAAKILLQTSIANQPKTSFSSKSIHQSPRRAFLSTPSSPSRIFLKISLICSLVFLLFRSLHFSFYFFIFLSELRVGVKLENGFAARAPMAVSETGLRSPVSEKKVKSTIIVIDNYDSFTYNLCQVISWLFFCFLFLHRSGKMGSISLSRMLNTLLLLLHVLCS